MIGALIEFLVGLLARVVLHALRHALAWYLLAAVLGLTAWSRQSVPLAIAAAIVVVFRLIFAWLEKQARTSLIDPARCDDQAADRGP